MADMTVGRVIPAINSGNYPLTEKELDKQKIVRCKDCEWRGNKKKCILAFVADKQEFPLFFYDQRGNWFCADGKPKGGDGEC